MQIKKALHEKEGFTITYSFFFISQAWKCLLDLAPDR
jgi:hypothetical protein